ncbi:hypothetical protein E3I90_04605 [Candidatus Bathyarchaeota archaeon]|nr:MAG: hypothetical protein E3I90_04605 [Candidatus Bathyarchaeota archaeon]
MPIDTVSLWVTGSYTLEVHAFWRKRRAHWRVGGDVDDGGGPVLSTVEGSQQRPGLLHYITKGEEAMSESTIQESRLKEYQAELLEKVSDPVHKRLIEAYQLKDPVGSMEDELGRILLEVLQNED